MNSSCNLDITPVIDGKGMVYVAVQTTVICVTPPSSMSMRPVASDFFSLIAQKCEGVRQTFTEVTGLAVSIWDSLIYINTGNEGLHAFMYDGTPLWSTHRRFNGSLMIFPESAASCASNVRDCYFISSPAIDQCDGSIYIARTDGWLYSFASWNPFLRWRYDFNVDGKPDILGITAGSNSHVYVASVRQNMVYALVAQTGALVWRKDVGPLGTRSNFPVVDFSGWVSIGSLDGFLYVLSPDGLKSKKYLSESADSPFVIQTSPLLDCSGKAIFVAQLLVSSKRIDQLDATAMVSFTNAWAVNIWMMVPATGNILWNTSYPGSFPVELLSFDLESYAFSSSWLLALAAIGSSRKGILIFALFVTTTIPMLIIVSILLYRCWSRWQNSHNLQLCKTLRQQKFLQPQVVLQTRRKLYHVAVINLHKRLKSDPDSQELLNELGANLERLHLVESLLSQYLTSPSILSNSDEAVLADGHVLSEEDQLYSSEDELSRISEEKHFIDDVTETSYERRSETDILRSPVQIENSLYLKSEFLASNYFDVMEMEEEITLLNEG